MSPCGRSGIASRKRKVSSISVGLEMRAHRSVQPLAPENRSSAFRPPLSPSPLLSALPTLVRPPSPPLPTRLASRPLLPKASRLSFGTALLWLRVRVLRWRARLRCGSRSWSRSKRGWVHRRLRMLSWSRTRRRQRIRECRCRATLYPTNRS